MSAQLEAGGVPTFACNARRPWHLGALLRLDRHIARIRPDLIHAMLTHANVAARLIARRRGIPVIGSTVTIEVERPLHRWLERRTAWMDAAHFVNSRAVAAHAQGVFRLPPERIHLVPASIAPPPAGLDREAIRRELGLRAKDFVVLWVGRLDPVKRVDWLIACAKELPAEFVFLIVGDGPQRHALACAIEREGLADRVRLLGWREDTPRFYAAADAFALPSRTEGMPNVVLEAMMAGLPVVASDLPPLREIAGEPRRLLLVGGDEPAALAECLRRLRDSPVERRRLSMAAAAWARETASEEASVQALLQMYSRVLCG